jgi:hypothetical protein
MHSHLFSTNYIFIFPRKLKLSKILANLQFIKRVRLFIDINEEKSREKFNTKVDRVDDDKATKQNTSKWLVTTSS